MSWPEEMPPKNTARVIALESAGSHFVAMLGSALFDRLEILRRISTPFTALMPIIALARSASSRSNTGSPQPGGTPCAMTVTRAPDGITRLGEFAK